MPVAQLRDGALQPTHARLVLLRVGDQADPLVAGEGSDVEPSLHRGIVAGEGRGQIVWDDVVHGACGEGLGLHSPDSSRVVRPRWGSVLTPRAAECATLTAGCSEAA